MKNIIQQMMDVYHPENLTEQKNLMKEVMQEIVLCGLSRAGFFNKAAFYGGTALRVFYGLDRFSEDLDFSLMVPDEDFELSDYFPILEKEISAYGLNMEIQEKGKTNDSAVKSAFLKGNTKEHLLLFYPEAGDFSSMPKNEVIKIKFEIDTNPPQFAGYERKYRLRPIPYEVNMYDASSLFAGKIHAVLGRAWKSRIKGRDLYDYIFYISRDIPVNLDHLRARLVQTGHLKPDGNESLGDIKRMLCERFDKIDYKQASDDVIPFIENPESVAIWNSDFFKEITNQLKC